MASSICSSLLSKPWRSYANDLDKAPHTQGIYAIGLKRAGDVRYIYVGHSKDIRRRLQKHKSQTLAIAQFVKAQFRCNDGGQRRQMANVQKETTQNVCIKNSVIGQSIMKRKEINVINVTPKSHQELACDSNQFLTDCDHFLETEGQNKAFCQKQAGMKTVSSNLQPIKFEIIRFSCSVLVGYNLNTCQ